MFSYINARGITNAVRGVWYGRYGSARCPAHDDQLPSLSLSNGHDGRLLLTCYAGCSFREIIQALRRIGLLGKQAFVDKAYDHRLSFSKQFSADLCFHGKCPHPLGMTLPALVALVKGAGSFAIHRTFLKANGCKTDQKPADDAGCKAGFTLAARAYSQGFEVFIMQAPNTLDFNDFLYYSR
ncbi:hypothetical protein [Bartonella sp. MM73XJBT.G]|uniref:hypothetical protein n=1 Tax=Bartonella sp. MM73XJBT.G TaxID=3019097 RepID=UPI00235FA0C1|nr:hypothetical protein [Bartonella sp. MM73XJBT.G]